MFFSLNYSDMIIPKIKSQLGVLVSSGCLGRKATDSLVSSGFPIPWLGL